MNLLLLYSIAMQMDFSLERKHQRKGSRLHALGENFCWCFNLKILFLFATWSRVVNTVSYSFNIITLLLCWYRIAENFRGRTLLRKNTIFVEKTFADCSLLLRQRMPCLPNFMEKTFANHHKTTKFAKVFSLESFPLYGMLFTHYDTKNLSYVIMKPVNHRTQVVHVLFTLVSWKLIL